MINVPRKETYIDWPFFIDPKGNIKFASKCNDCTLECKQSFRVRVYRIYDDTDIKKFCDVYFAKGAQGENAQGILASKLFPAIDR